MAKKILIVDDEPEIIETYSEIFKMKDYLVDKAMNRQDALDQLESFKPDLVTLDIEFGHGRSTEGIEILKLIRARWTKDELPVLIVSGKGSSEDFVEAMQIGVNGVVLKSKIDKVVDKAKEILHKKESETEFSQKNLPDRMRGKGTREITIQLFECAERDCNVLILGETGTGKNLAAEIYRQSSRRKDIFYRIDCAAMPENLMQSELFGVESGGFTGAKQRKGKLEEADHGIVFFDEIGELTSGQQKVLLDFWDTREITRIGSNRKRKLDVVILAATNQNLEQLTGEKKFRPDLFRRLWTNVIRMPALREIREDIPVLVEGFINKFNQQYHKKVEAVDSEVIDLFMRLPWRGNVGELRNCIGHGVLNCVGPVIHLEDIKNIVQNTFSGTRSALEETPVQPNNNSGTIHDLRRRHEEEEKEFLQQKYAGHGRNQSRTAREINISRERLIQLLKKHGII